VNISNDLSQITSLERWKRVGMIEVKGIKIKKESEDATKMKMTIETSVMIIAEIEKGIEIVSGNVQL